MPRRILLSLMPALGVQRLNFLVKNEASLFLHFDTNIDGSEDSLDSEIIRPTRRSFPRFT